MTSAGFTPRDMTATAVGTLSRHGDDVVLHWADSDVEILLEGGDAFDRVTLPSSESVRVTGTLTVLRDEEKELHSLVMTVEALVTVGSQD